MRRAVARGSNLRAEAYDPPIEAIATAISHASLTSARIPA